MQRQLGRKPLGSITSPVSDESIDQVSGDRSGGLFERACSSRGEVLANQATQQCVRRRIGLEQRDWARPAVLPFTASNGQLG